MVDGSKDKFVRLFLLSIKCLPITSPFMPTQEIIIFCFHNNYDMIFLQLYTIAYVLADTMKSKFQCICLLLIFVKENHISDVIALCLIQGFRHQQPIHLGVIVAGEINVKYLGEDGITCKIDCSRSNSIPPVQIDCPVINIFQQPLRSPARVSMQILHIFQN